MRLLILLIGLALVTSCAESEPENLHKAWNTLDGQPPLVIGHRGASALLPPHTMAAYALAIEQGADIIEPDLVLSKDLHLVCLHDRFLSRSTNISEMPEFADRKATKEGREDWWAEDFTLAELKSLKVREDYPHRTKSNDDKYPIASFAEVIALAKKSITEGKPVKIFPEPKEAAKLAAIGFDIETALVDALNDAGWTSREAPVLIQSFEIDVVKSLNQRIDVTLIQLVVSKTWFDENAEFVSFIPLEVMPDYADGVGPDKRLIVGEDGTPTDFIERAHKLGLVVHPWTFYGDKPAYDDLTPEAELKRMYQMGADGVFADWPEQAIKVREQMF